MPFLKLNRDQHLNKPFLFRFGKDAMEADPETYQYQSNGQTRTGETFIINGAYVGDEPYYNEAKGEQFKFDKHTEIDRFEMTPKLWEKLAPFKAGDTVSIALITKEGYDFPLWDIKKVASVVNNDNGSGNAPLVDKKPDTYKPRTTNDSIESQVATKICSEMLVHGVITMDKLEETHRKVVSVIREEYATPLEDYYGDNSPEVEAESEEDDMPF